MNIIIAGIQGSGKGTQSQKLAHHYNLKHISTGDVLRKHIEEKTDFGIKYEEENKKGNLAPDEIIFDIIKHEISDLGDKHGFILDGFPRTEDQCWWVLDNLDIDYVIKLDLDDDAAYKRILLRRRIDDTQLAASNRFNTFRTITEPALDLLNVDITVNANKSEDMVFQNIITKIDETIKKPSILQRIANFFGGNSIVTEIFGTFAPLYIYAIAKKF